MVLLGDIIEKISNILWGGPLIILLVGTHLYLTVRLKFPQRHIFKAIKLSFSKEKGSDGDVSAYGALFTALAATIGTGNIIGVGTAVALGGPGAIFWCWLTGFLGISTKYAEALLAVRFRVKTNNGEMLGGPMYALERGMGMKWLAVLFCIFTVLASFGIGNTVQANATSFILNTNYNIPTYVTGIVICILVGLVKFFGIKGISKTCTLLVPFMAVFYITCCLTILFINHDYIISAFYTIIENAFKFDSVGGGIVGGGIITTVRYGVSRGLFSNESGLGSAPIVAAAARTKNPVRQAMVSSTGTFWDTVVICALTGIVIVSTMLKHPELETSQNTTLITHAFNLIPHIGPLVLTIGLVTFSLSTILGWSYYSEKAIEYLGGKKSIKYFNILWIIAVFIGSVVELKIVWNMADCMNALMAIPNLISILFLFKIIEKETKKYLWNSKLDKQTCTEMNISNLKREHKLRRRINKKSQH